MPSETPQQPGKFYLTTPIYYVNGRPHIGHAYTTIVADVLARRHRLLGDRTFFLTGTDEHGQKIERSAAAAGIPPQQFADQVSAEFRQLWDRMGLTYSKYIRTTEPDHKRGVQQLFRTLYDRGFIYLSTYTGSYCVSDEAFVDQPAGTPCPDCGRTLETVTEENFFFKLSEFQKPLLDLIESHQLHITPESARNEVLSFIRGNTNAPLATSSSRPEQTPDDPSSRPERSEVERPAGLPPQPLTTIDSSSRPERSEVERPAGLAPQPPTPTDSSSRPERSGVERPAVLPTTAAGTPYLPGALKDLSVSRSSFTWGIPVPKDIQQRATATQPHVVYVWLDALANYITAIGYGDPDEAAQAQFKALWPADLHLVGKEITRFHCVYWPAFLLAAGLPTPKQITANGWLLFDNAKMSKSKGNVVRTETILDAFGDQVYGKQFPDSPKHERDLFAADVLRYFLLREIPFGQDGSFSFDAMVTRYNADLANGYGNLVSRVLKMLHDNFGSTVPNVCADHLGANTSTTYKHSNEPAPETTELVNYLVVSISAFNKLIGENSLTASTAVIAACVSTIDRYISDQAPWKLAKSPESQDRGKLADVLYTAAEAIRIITILLHPVMPYTTQKVWQQLGLDPATLTTPNAQATTTWGGLQPGTPLGPLSPLFPRADKSLAQVMIDMEDSRNTATTPDNKPSTDPAAGPRTSTLGEPAATLPVGGSTAEQPALPTTPGPASTAPASGVFAAQPAAGDANQPITIDDFLKVELRVAQVLVAERIPKADKLLRLEVDLGDEKRQILSGIAQWYTPEDLIGRRIVVVSNLAPRKMRGLESHGMLLAASEGPDGKPVLATFGEDIALGSRVR